MDWPLYCYRRIRHYFIKKTAQLCFPENEWPEESLILLLKLMSFSYYLDRDLRKSIRGFHGLIQFRSMDDEVIVLAEFKNNCLKLKELKPKEKLTVKPNVTIVFKNINALKDYLFHRSSNWDIRRLNQTKEVIIEGNLNYIYRFRFLAEQSIWRLEE